MQRLWMSMTFVMLFLAAGPTVGYPQENDDLPVCPKDCAPVDAANAFIGYGGTRRNARLRATADLVNYCTRVCAIMQCADARKSCKPPENKYENELMLNCVQLRNERWRCVATLVKCNCSCQ